MPNTMLNTSHVSLWLITISSRDDLVRFTAEAWRLGKEGPLETHELMNAGSRP